MAVFFDYLARRVESATFSGAAGSAAYATLGGAMQGYSSIASGMAVGDSAPYCLLEINTSNWQAGIGTLSAAGQWTFTTCTQSSNSNAVVTFGTGGKILIIGGASVAEAVHNALSKATPVDADELGLWDSVASKLAKLTWANLKATLKTYFDTLYAAASALTAHTGNTANPHAVTKAQVGLGSADNTSDAAKPISTATQSALDGKAPLNGTGTSGTWPINVTGSAGSASWTPLLRTQDTRSTDSAPGDLPVGVTSDFKYNATDGLADGGTFHETVSIKGWNDASGGGARQLAFTDNNNLWVRGSGTAQAAWSAWKQVIDSASIGSFAPTLTGGGASGTWAISISGTAANASAVAWSGVTGKPTTVGGYGITDVPSTMQSWAGGSSYNANCWNFFGTTANYTDAAVEIRENNLGGAGTGAWSDAPHLSFHWGGRVASQVAMGSDGVVAIRNIDGTAYQSFKAQDISANGTFYGNGSGLSSVNAATVGGLAVASPSTTPGANQIPRTDSNGYTFFGYIHSATANAENPAPNQFIVTNGGDGYYRKASFSFIQSSLFGDFWNGYTAGVMGKRRTRYHSADGTSISNVAQLVGLDTGFDYDTGGAGVNGPFVTFGGLNANTDYVGQFTAAYGDASSSILKFRVRNGDTNVWNSWASVILDANIASYAPSLTGAGASGTWSISITGNAATLGGVAKQGYTQASNAGIVDFNDAFWNDHADLTSLNATAANSPFGAGWYTIANIRHRGGAGDGTSWGTQLAFGMTGWLGRGALRSMNSGAWSGWNELVTSGNYTNYSPTLTGTGASGTWGISVTGSAGTAGSAGYVSSQGSASGLVKTGRTVLAPGVYTYGGISDPNAPTTYFSGMGFGNGAGGSLEVGGAWFGTTGMWYRSLRDTTDPWTGWTRLIDAANVGSYAPGLTGAGASGNWGISITGQAASVFNLTLNSSATPTHNPDSVTQNQIGYSDTLSVLGQTDGGLYSAAYDGTWLHQIYGDFRTGQIAVRGKNSGTWQAWRTVLDASNVRTVNGVSLLGSGDINTSTVATGDVVYSARTSISGYLKCDGSNYAKSSYSALATALGSLPDGGKLWTPITFTSSATGKIDGCYGGGVYLIAVGGYAYYSTDGTTFNAGNGSNQVMPNPGRTRFLNGKFWFIGSDNVSSRSTASSTDGATWTYGTQYVGQLVDMAYGASKYVGIQGNSVYYSSDGGISAAWTQVVLSASLGSIVFGNGIFVASTTGTASAGVFTSSDGVTWTFRAISGFPNSTMASTLAFGNGVFVLWTPGWGMVWTSTDGITWAPHNTPLPGLGATSGIEFTNGLFVVASQTGNTAGRGNWIGTSANGVDWKLIDHLPSGGNTQGYWAVGNGVMFISTNTSGSFYKSALLTYNTATNFAVPELPNLGGMAAFIKT